VRLHQPYTHYTLPDREWTLQNKNDDYLANKQEILEYLENVVKSCVRESGIKLVELFNTEVCFQSIKMVNNRNVVKCTDKIGASVEIHSSRVINAIGANIQPTNSYKISANDDYVRSITIYDICQSKWKHQICATSAPIYIIGSGKTAMDTILWLSKIPEVKNRVHIISGRGVYFINRDAYKSNLNNYTFKLISDFDTNNIDDVYVNALKKGIFLSAHPNPKKWNLGIISEQEIEVIKNMIQHKILDKRLLKVDNDGKFILQDANNNTSPLEYLSVPKGTIIINCATRSIHDNNSVKKEGVLKYDNLFLTIPTNSPLGYTYDTSHILTHFWYMDYFKNTKMLRYEINIDSCEKEYILVAFVCNALNKVYLPYPKNYSENLKTDREYTFLTSRSNKQFPPQKTNLNLLDMKNVQKIAKKFLRTNKISRNT